MLSGSLALESVSENSSLSDKAFYRVHVFQTFFNCCKRHVVEALFNSPLQDLGTAIKYISAGCIKSIAALKDCSCSAGGGVAVMGRRQARKERGED